MNREQWQQLQELFDDAVQLDPAERPAFLDQHCSSDLELRRELEEMLSVERKLNSSFLESPALEQAAARLASSTNTSMLAAGTNLGPYVVQVLLGAGGMGEVYRALDTRLDRTVAIKLMPRALAPNAVRRQRFEREARAISSLQHPNICTLYDVGSQDGTEYLVMEYLEGETLAARLMKGRLPLDLTLRYASEVADALDMAHRRGIVHRDLKPGNIFITTHGESKVLDFGLVKLEEKKASSETPTTLTAQANADVLTTPGVAMGTVAYMSPEQARGEELDARTDIFSLGAVLYEMATGKTAFPGKTAAVVFKAILDETPSPPTKIERSLPAELDRIAQKALEKDRNLRYQHAADMRTDLQRLKRDTESGRMAAPSSGKTEASATPMKRLWKFVVPTGVVVVALMAGGAYYYRSHQVKRLTERDTIVLAEFENRTGDGVFDDALKQALAVELSQSPFLNIISERKVSATLKFMGRKAGEHLTRDLAIEVCERSGSKAVVSGSISSLGTQYVLGLEAIACGSGDTLAKEQVNASSKEGVLKALDTASSAIRTKLGESLASVTKFNAPLEITTSSLEALKALSEGRVAMYTRGANQAIPFFKRATELDSNFALAYLLLGHMYSMLNESQLSAENYKKAFELRSRVSERESFEISASYYSAVTGEIEKAIQARESLIQSYPANPVAHTNLGISYSDLGQYQKAIPHYQEALRLNPNDSMAYDNLLSSQMALNQLQEADVVVAQAMEHKLDNGLLHQGAYLLAFLKKDSAEMQKQVSWGAALPGEEDALLFMQSDTEAYYGRLAKARDFSRFAVGSASRANHIETAAGWEAKAALREAECGNVALARHHVTVALAMSKGKDVRIAAALTLARIRDYSGSQRILSELHQAQPSSTFLNVFWLPTIRATLEINRGHVEQASALLEASLPYETGEMETYVSYLYPAYVRGQAYLLTNNGTAAASEFQKLLDHRGIVGNWITGALANLQLGRAYAMEGETVKAKAAYKDFLTLWKDADSDIPILKQAKAEYAKLQ